MQEAMSTTKRELTVFGIISEAWKLTYGAKWAICLPALFVMIPAYIAIIFMTIVFFMGGGSGITGFIFIVIGIGLLYLMIGCLCGALKVSIERARGKFIRATSGFHSFSRVIPMVLTLLLVGILLLPGNLLQYIPGLNGQTQGAMVTVFILKTVYGLLVGSLVYMSFPLVIDKINSPFAALYRSFKASWQHWLKLIGVFVIAEIISLISMIPFMLGMILKNQIVAIVGCGVMFVALIWILPFLFLIQGVIYHKLFD